MKTWYKPRLCVFCTVSCQAEEERDGMEKVKLDNRRILFNLLPAHVAQHFLMSNPRNMVSLANRQADRHKDKQVDDKQVGAIDEYRKRRCFTPDSFITPLGSVLPVVRTGRRPVCINPELQ